MKVIVTADDFGFSSEVNRAVLRAHREGVLTSASLMVTGDAVDEAVEIARANPSLAVGLHLALSRARSALPREAVPDLVDSDRMFPNGAVSAGLRLYFSRRARTQLRAEIEAQFEAFARHGIPLSHVDGHQHLHAHPAVLPIVTELASRQGAQGLRIPSEPLLASLRADRSRPVYKLAVALGHAFVRGFGSRSPRGSCQLVIGSMMSGGMTDDYVISMLSASRVQVSEVFFHPCEEESGEPYGPNPGDLRALLSPRLKEFLTSSDYELTTYAGLARETTSEHH
jgi:hopanoid biosynthesis associated protein HpnK